MLIVNIKKKKRKEGLKMEMLSIILDVLMVIANLALIIMIVKRWKK